MSETNIDIKKGRKKLEEKELIESSLRGDEEAFAKLYNRYHDQVYGFCSRLLRGKHDVEDAAQQVFFEAWRSLARFEGRSLFSTWLTKIAIHTCLSFHRRSGRVVLSGSDPEPFHLANDLLWREAENNPDEEMFLAERREMVNKLLSRMTEKKKVVFVLSDMHGMTAPEISILLKIPDATVRTRLFHARREFSNWIERNKDYRDVLMPAWNGPAH